MSDDVRFLFEALPIPAALVAIILCSYRAIATNDRVLRVVCLAGVFNGILMIVAQVSWAWSFFIKNDLLGTDSANIMWTVLNTSTMVTAAYLAYGERQ